MLFKAVRNIKEQTNSKTDFSEYEDTEFNYFIITAIFGIHFVCSLRRK